MNRRRFLGVLSAVAVGAVVGVRRVVTAALPARRITASPGLPGYDLLMPSRQLYPTLSPLKNRIARQPTSFTFTVEPVDGAYAYAFFPDPNAKPPEKFALPPPRSSFLEWEQGLGKTIEQLPAGQYVDGNGIVHAAGDPVPLIEPTYRQWGESSGFRFDG